MPVRFAVSLILSISGSAWANRQILVSVSGNNYTGPNSVVSCTSTTTIHLSNPSGVTQTITMPGGYFNGPPNAATTTQCGATNASVGFPMGQPCTLQLAGSTGQTLMGGLPVTSSISLIANDMTKLGLYSISIAEDAGYLIGEIIVATSCAAPTVSDMPPQQIIFPIAGGLPF